MEETRSAALAILAESSDARSYRIHPDRPLEGWAIQSGHQIWLWASGLRPLQPEAAGEVVTYAVWAATPGGNTLFLGSAGTGAGGTVVVTLPVPEAGPLAALLVTAQRAQTARPAAVVLAGRLHHTVAPAAPATVPHRPGVEGAAQGPEPVAAPEPKEADHGAAQPVDATELADAAQAPVPAETRPAINPDGEAEPAAPVMAGGGEPVLEPGGSAGTGVLLPDPPAPTEAQGSLAEVPTRPGAPPAEVPPPSAAPVAQAPPPSGPESPAKPEAAYPPAPAHPAGAAHPPAPARPAAAHPPAPEAAAPEKTLPTAGPHPGPEPPVPPGCVALDRLTVELEPTGRGVVGGLSGASGTAHLDFGQGSLLLTLRGLPRPEQLGTASQTGRPYNAYRVWLQSGGTRQVAPLGIATRVWSETYRLQIRQGLALRRFDALLVTVEDRAGSGARPSGPVILTGRYRWYRPRT